MHPLPVQGLYIDLLIHSISSPSYPAPFCTQADHKHCSFLFYLFPDHITPIPCSHRNRSTCTCRFSHLCVWQLCVPGSHKNDNTMHHVSSLFVFLSEQEQYFFPAYPKG